MLLLIKLKIHIQSPFFRRSLQETNTSVKRTPRAGYYLSLLSLSLTDSIRRTSFSEGHLGPISKVSVFEGVVDCSCIGKTYILGAREIL